MWKEKRIGELYALEYKTDHFKLRVWNERSRKRLDFEDVGDNLPKNSWKTDCLIGKEEHEDYYFEDMPIGYSLTPDEAKIKALKYLENRLNNDMGWCDAVKKAKESLQEKVFYYRYRVQLAENCIFGGAVKANTEEEALEKIKENKLKREFVEFTNSDDDVVF